MYNVGLEHGNQDYENFSGMVMYLLEGNSF